MALVLLPILLLIGPGVWRWARALADGRWRHSAAWFSGTAALLLMATGVTYLSGALAGASLDPEEACHADGQTYDAAYRRAHLDAYTRWFPLHDKCNAGYDLVPGWVNPALVTLPVLAVACVAYGVWLGTAGRRTSSQGR
ncbi:hypothetical protein [Streptomyces sp. NPDC026659]|uniref:hypothetical protein n=1 Tax=Streptomyces sp. NPDC026659 TaxID=3155123 RepID=UPI0033F43998